MIDFSVVRDSGKHYLNPMNTFVGFFISMWSLAVGIYYLLTSINLPLNEGVFWSAAVAAIGFMLAKFMECRTKRYNVLCNLEVELNQAMDALSCMTRTLQNMVNSYVPLLLPHELLYLTPEYVKSVGRIDIKNDLADLMCDFRRINQDWNNLIQYGQEHLKAIEDPTHPQHTEARVFGTELLKSVQSRCQQTDTLIQDTLALVRVYMSHDKTFFAFGQPFLSSKKLEAEVKSVKAALLSELAEKGA